MMHSTTTTATCAGCQSAGHCCCEGTLERPRFFARQLVTPAELNLASAYVLERLRRHNRLLHGWGVICGAQVCRVAGADGTTAQAWKVRIRPGHLIDGCGNDVTIDCDRVIDLRSGGAVVAGGDPAGEPRDPWCSDVWTQSEGGRIWIAVCYKEILARPVRTQPTGCGCDDTSCEYSRWVDGYEVRLLDACPPSHQAPPPPEALREGLTGRLPDCPPCPDDPCVVLAAVDVDVDGTITAIDNCSCRRMVASAAGFWWRCGGVVSITGVAVAPDGPHAPGAIGIELQVEGVNLRDDVEVDLGSGVKVGTLSMSDGKLVIPVEISEEAEAGDRTLTLTTGDCSSATWAKALTVSDAAASANPTAAAAKPARRRRPRS